MKNITVVLLAAVLIAGCSKNQSEDKQAAQTVVEPDNSGRNVRDRDNQNKTSGDQSESEADRTISQNIRAAITADDSLSTNGKNVKIITSDGTVTLRGPVKSDQEKTTDRSESETGRRRQESR